jgi:hypothetical protein
MIINLFIGFMTVLAILLLSIMAMLCLFLVLDDEGRLTDSCLVRIIAFPAGVGSVIMFIWLLSRIGDIFTK